MAARPTLINSVVRALNLLDAVGEAACPMSAKRLTRITGLPPSTVYHLLRTLAHEGYLRRTVEGYILGDQVDVLIGSRASAASARRCRQVLQQLHDEIGAAAYLCLFDDGEIQVVEIVDSPAAPRTDLWVGIHDAAHATAMGKAVLAALPEAARRAYVQTHPMADLTPRTVTSRRVLLRDLAASLAVRVDQEEYALGTVCLAAPVPSADWAAAIAVSVPTHRGPAVLARSAALRRAARLVALAGAPALSPSEKASVARSPAMTQSGE